MTHDGAVLIIGAGALQVPMIQEAKRLGLFALATDINPAAPGAALADHFRALDTYDRIGHVHWARQLATGQAEVPVPPLLGVTTCGADVAPTVAAVAAALELPGLPFDVALDTHDKHTVRHTLHHAGLALYQPQWLLADLKHDARETVCACLHAWGDVVIKPLSQRASRGVTLIDHALLRTIECAGLIDQALARLRSYGRRFLIEERLRGTEHSAEVVLGPQDTVLFANIVDRPFAYQAGYALELGHVNPTRLDQAMCTAIHTMVLQCAHAMGVAHGPFKLDVMATDDGPKVLEATARLSGGFDCQMTTPLATGRNPIRQVLQLACGLEVDRCPPRWQRFAACAAAFPPPGTILATPRQVQGSDGPLTEQVRHMPGIEQVILTAEVGDVLEPYTHCAQRPGFVLAVADTYDLAWQQALAGANALATGFILASS
jgi:biotin carboxylase